MSIAETDASTNANTISIITLVVFAFLMWRQNVLIKKQNDILAKENELSPSPSGRFSRLHSYWPLMAMCILSFLGWGAVLYYRGDRRDSVLVLTVILLSALLAIAWPLITMLRRNKPAQLNVPIVPLPEFPSPFAETPKEIIETMRMTGRSASLKDGSFELQEGDRLSSEQFFKPPIAFRVVAKTDSLNLRLGYITNLIFNWECCIDHLRVGEGPLDGRHKEKAGEIPRNQWVTIDLIFRPHSMEVAVNGIQRYFQSADFSKASEKFSIWQYQYAIIHVKSVLVGRPNDAKDAMSELTPDDVVDAIYGEGDPSVSSRWIKLTAKNQKLADRVKYLLRLRDPVRLNNENLEVADPVKDTKKQLKLRLSAGNCFYIDEEDYLSFKSMRPCAPF